MLIPRFTLRTYLWATLGVALLGSAGAAAVRGHRWGLAMMAAAAFVPFAFALYALFFVLAWGFVEGALARAKRREQPTSPFATDRPAEQILPPMQQG